MTPYKKTKALLAAVFLLVLASPVSAEPLPCESEYDSADDVRFELTNPALSTEKKAEYEAQLKILQPKLDSCFEEYASKNGEEAYRDLVYRLGG